MIEGFSLIVCASCACVIPLAVRACNFQSPAAGDWDPSDPQSRPVRPSPRLPRPASAHLDDGLPEAGRDRLVLEFLRFPVQLGRVQRGARGLVGAGSVLQERGSRTRDSAGTAVGKARVRTFFTVSTSAPARRAAFTAAAVFS